MTPLIDYVTPTYTEKNLSFDIHYILLGIDTFVKLRALYTQYKIDKIVFNAIPRIVNGTDPGPAWIYLDRAGRNNFNYAEMPTLQGSKALPVKHFSLTTYSSTGMQKDFHYWYDVDTEEFEEHGLQLRFRSAIVPDQHIHWSFQILYYVKFRGLYTPVSNSKDQKVDIKQIKEQDTQSSIPLEPGSAQKEEEESEYSYSDEDDFNFDDEQQ